MKKILIGLIILLLLILGYFMCFQSINIGNIKIESINNIKDMSNNLNEKIQQAYKLSDQTYPKELSNLEDATKKLETSKNQYNTKVSYTTSNGDAFGAYLRKYKIETLMVDLGRHSKQNGLKDLKLDLKTTNSSDVYDLELTIVGTYESVYNFIYSIENDDDLLFEIVGLKVEPYMVQTTTTVTNPETKKTNSLTDYPYNIKEVITSSEVADSKENKSTSNTSDKNTTNNSNTNTTTTNDTTTKDTTTNKNTQNTTKTDVTYDPKNVQAEFTVENITISFE